MNFVVLAPLRKRRTEVTALGPEAWGAGRRLAVLLAPVAAGLVVGFDPGRAVWGWVGLAIVGLEFAGHVARRGAVPVSPRTGRRWRRQLRRRRIINRRRHIYAERQKARAIRDARERRTRRRRRRRRRLIQAYTVPGGWRRHAAVAGRAPIIAADPIGTPAAVPAGDIHPVETPEAERVIEIDLTDRTIYDSQITLESGDTLESGVVGPCSEVSPASGQQRQA